MGAGGSEKTKEKREEGEKQSKEKRGFSLQAGSTQQQLSLAREKGEKKQKGGGEKNKKE